MTNTNSVVAARIALLVDRELADDAVEVVWTLYWHARRLTPGEVDDAQRSAAAEVALRALILEGVKVGELDERTGEFRLLGTPNLADDLLSRIRALGREPNMGDIGWLVKDVYP